MSVLRSFRYTCALGFFPMRFLRLLYIRRREYKRYLFARLQARSSLHQHGLCIVGDGHHRCMLRELLSQHRVDQPARGVNVQLRSNLLAVQPATEDLGVVVALCVVEAILDAVHELVLVGSVAHNHKNSSVHAATAEASSELSAFGCENPALAMWCAANTLTLVVARVFFAQESESEVRHRTVADCHVYGLVEFVGTQSCELD